MHDKRLETMLDDWGASEAMSAPPLPSTVSSRLGRIRAQRAVTIGVCVIAAVALLIALGFAVNGTNEVAPPPEAPAEVISEATVNPTIGEIYSLNNGLRAGADGEIVLPATGGLGDGERAPMTVRSTLPD